MGNMIAKVALEDENFFLGSDDNFTELMTVLASNAPLPDDCKKDELNFGMDTDIDSNGELTNRSNRSLTKNEPLESPKAQDI